MLLSAVHHLLEAGSCLRLSTHLLRPCSSSLHGSFIAFGGVPLDHQIVDPTLLHHRCAWSSPLPHSSAFSTSSSSEPSPSAALELEEAGTAAPAPAADQPSTSKLFSSGARKVDLHVGRRQAASGLHGIVHVHDAASNMILSFTDPAGRVLAWTSSGSMGYRNSRKGLPVAAERAAEELAKRAMKLGYSSASVKMKGIGNNKQYAVQSLSAAGLRLTQLMDVTPIPYNGCRRPKKRRV